MNGLHGPMRRVYVGEPVGARSDAGDFDLDPAAVRAAATLMAVHGQRRPPRRTTAQVWRSRLWRARRMSAPLVVIFGLLGVRYLVVGLAARDVSWASTPAWLALAVVAVLVVVYRRAGHRWERYGAAGTAAVYLLWVISGA